MTGFHNVKHPNGAALATARDGMKYPVILADPPWHFDNFSDKHNPGTRKYGGAAQHYSTMSIDDLCTLPIRDLAEKDAVLFLWVTWPHLYEAAPVIKAWGFEYKTLAFDWVKVRRGLKLHFGMGFWTRANSEACLLCTRGSPKRRDNNVAQVIWEWEYESETIVAPFRGHSVKPETQYDRIEKLLAGPYLELFARRPRPGWHVWGNEVESDIELVTKGVPR